MITLIVAIAVGGGSFAAAYWAAGWGAGWSVFAGVVGFGVFQGVFGGGKIKMHRPDVRVILIRKVNGDQTAHSGGRLIH